MNWVFLKPYVCRDCAERFYAFPSGVNGPTLRMEFDARLHGVTSRTAWKRNMRELIVYGVAGIVLIVTVYMMAPRSYR